MVLNGSRRVHGTGYLASRGGFGSSSRNRSGFGTRAGSALGRLTGDNRNCVDCRDGSEGDESKRNQLEHGDNPREREKERRIRGNETLEGV